MTDPIQGQSQGHELLAVGNPAIFKSCLLCHLQWKLATDHGFSNYCTMSKFVQAGFVIFILVFVSRVLEVGRNVSCEESTISPHTGLILFQIIPMHARDEQRDKPWAGKRWFDGVLYNL